MIKSTTSKLFRKGSGQIKFEDVGETAIEYSVQVFGLCVAMEEEMKDDNDSTVAKEIMGCCILELGRSLSTNIQGDIGLLIPVYCSSSK